MKQIDLVALRACGLVECLRRYWLGFTRPRRLKWNQRAYVGVNLLVGATIATATSLAQAMNGYAGGLIAISARGAEIYPSSAGGTDLYKVQLTSKSISTAIVDKVNSQLSKLCHEAENPYSPKHINSTESALNYMSPAVPVLGALISQYGIKPEGKADTTVLSAPTHGKIVNDIWVSNDKDLPSASYQLFKYLPDKNFYGVDHVKFEVKVNGKTFRVSLKINVVETSMDGDSCREQGQVTR